MYNHLEDTENVFVLAAHTFCSCVKAMCRSGWGTGAVHTTACPCVTHRTSCPPCSRRPSCLLHVFDEKMLLDVAADSVVTTLHTMGFLGDDLLLADLTVFNGIYRQMKCCQFRAGKRE